MADPERAVHGDFRVIRMDGLFHVVYRPDADPEWFRIIATFYTYERAYSYCDVERVSVWTYSDSEKGTIHAESETGEEELLGLRAPPIEETVSQGWMASRDGCAEMVRDICSVDDRPLPPWHPDEDFSDHPNEDEPPKDYHKRLHEEAVAKQPPAEAPIRAEPVPTPEPEPEDEEEPDPDPLADAARDLSDHQWSVLKYFRDHVGEDRTIRASFKTIADEAEVAAGSCPFLIEVLEQKGFITKAERGTSKSATLWRLHTAEEVAAAGDKAPRCRDCGGPRSIGSAGQCRACYQKELAALPDGVVAELSEKGRRHAVAARSAEVMG